MCSRGTGSLPGLFPLCLFRSLYTCNKTNSFIYILFSCVLSCCLCFVRLNSFETLKSLFPSSSCNIVLAISLSPSLLVSFFSLFNVGAGLFGMLVKFLQDLFAIIRNQTSIHNSPNQVAIIRLPAANKKSYLSL